MHRQLNLVKQMIVIQNVGFSSAVATKKPIPLITCKNTKFNLMYDESKKILKPKPTSDIELASKGWQHYKAKKDHFIIHPIKNVIESNEENSTEIEKLELNEQLINNAKEKHDVKKVTKLQTDVIKEIEKGQNVLIAAETGCGKTHAYLLPIINQIVQRKQNDQPDRQFNTPRVLILTPGRELADQIGKFAEELAEGLEINIKVITGGNTKQKVLNPSFEDIDILVGSIGAISKLTTTGIYRMNAVEFVVLDEADALLEDGFNEKLSYYLKRFSFHLNTRLVLVSATMPTNTDEVFREVIDTDTLIKVVSNDLHKILPYVTQKFCRMSKADRPENLIRIVKSEIVKRRPVIVFSNKSATSDYISILLNNNNVNCLNINGDMLMKIREGRFKKFQDGEVHVISTTDCVARGLNTVRARHIINFDFPLHISDYIHRCGRIGRLGSNAHCHITNFISSLRELDLVRQIELSARTDHPLEGVNANIRNIISTKIEKELKKFEDHETKELLRSM